MNAGLRPAGARDEALIKNIFNMYQNELSPYTEDFPYLDDEGYFDARAARDVLPFGNGVYPYIVQDGGRNMGFILVTGVPYVLPGCDWCFQEAFVIARARGTGLARAAAKLAMEGRPGRWGLSVYAKNARARAFWRGLISELGAKAEISPGGNGMENVIFDYGGEAPEIAKNT